MKRKKTVRGLRKANVREVIPETGPGSRRIVGTSQKRGSSRVFKKGGGGAGVGRNNPALGSRTVDTSQGVGQSHTGWMGTRRLAEKGPDS